MHAHMPTDTQITPIHPPIHPPTQTHARTPCHPQTETQKKNTLVHVHVPPPSCYGNVAALLRMTTSAASAPDLAPCFYLNESRCDVSVDILSTTAGVLAVAVQNPISATLSAPVIRVPVPSGKTFVAKTSTGVSDGICMLSER